MSLGSGTDPPIDCPGCLVEEEAAEVLEAIDTENVELLREELGDLLLQGCFSCPD